MKLDYANLDINDHAQVLQIGAIRDQKADEYVEARLNYAKAKCVFEFAVADLLPSLRILKPNIGIETAQIMALEKDRTLRTVYETMVYEENRFKGLEKKIESLASQTTLVQTLVKDKIQKGA